MEVFIPFDGKDEAIPFLEKALNGWAGVRFAVPSVIQEKPGEMFDLRSRVIADNLAKDQFYILADIDAAPEERYFISDIHKRLATQKTVGMALIRPVFDLGGRIRILRKGAIEKWPEPTGEPYDITQAEAIVKAGYTMETWDDIFYRYLPSPIVH